MLYIILAVVCTAAMFTLNKFYQLKFCNNTNRLLAFPLVSSVFSWVFYFVLNAFKMEYSSITVVFALLFALTNTFNNVVGLVIMKHCKMSLYMSFLMIGGMFVPFLYGVFFLNESFTPLRGIALAILIIALFLPTFVKSEEKTSKLGIFLCLGVFISNGFVSTFSKMHQINLEALGTNDFMMWASVFSLVLTVAVFVCFNLKNKCSKRNEGQLPSENTQKQPKILLKILALLIAISAINALGILFNLTGAKEVDAAMLYPMITGGTIVLTSVSGWLIYKESANVLSIVGVAAALLGTILFAL